MSRRSRDLPGGADARIVREDGATAEWRVEAGDGVRRDLPDGRSVSERAIALPALPIGRYRLIVDGVECALTVAPPEGLQPRGGVAQTVRRRRSDLRAQRADEDGRRSGDRRLLDPGARAAEKAGAAGAAYLGVSPLHMLFPRDRERASPYYPSDRRFLDPILIDALDDAGLPRDEAVDAALTALAPAFAAASATKTVEYEAVWRAKRTALEAWSAAFARARAARPGDPLIADYHAFARSGGEALRRFAAFQATADGEAGENWRLWPQALRDGEPKAIDDAIERSRQAFEFALFCQWLADRQLARAAERARRTRPRDRILSRSRGRRRAGRSGILGARRERSPAASRSARRPIRFPPRGRTGTCRRPIRSPARARAGPRSARSTAPTCATPACCASITRWACERLFLIPEGAKPAEGAYLSYPLDDLIGHIALESQRARCMVVGEDLGTVPEGFRDRMTRANIQGMRVLWFERDGPRVRPPEFYPPLSVACVATHDLATLAGWWQGADIAERLSLGLLTLAKAGEEIAGRREEKRGLIAAFSPPGSSARRRATKRRSPTPSPPPSTRSIGGAGSILAHAQFDDLVGETVQTNLPGTDRERPNWRLKLGPDVAAAFAGHRAQAILAALAKGRT